MRHRKSQSGLWLVAVMLAWPMLIAPVPAAAQARRESDAFINQQRAARDRIWEQIDRQGPLTGDIAVDYGGAYSFNLFIWDDGVNSSRTFRRNDWRVWTRVTLDGGAHELFARARLSYLDFNEGDSFDGNDDDWDGPNLERGFYQFDLRQARVRAGHPPSDSNLRFKIGRDLVEFGTGYALSLLMDHVRVDAEYNDFEVTGIVGRSVGSSNDFDQSRPIDRTRRAFFGAEARYTGFERHRPFAYVLWQADHNDEFEITPLQRFDYDSLYVGLGSYGELVDNLVYRTEWVYEEGASFGDRQFIKKNHIRAWAFDVELEYLFDAPMSPRASIEYMFASGDGDRRFSPVNTIGGNRGDFTDNSFIGFGWRDTGVSFAPRRTNVHIWRTGASFYPFERDATLDRLELGTNWFLYWKHHRQGAVSDPTANVRSGYLGWEMDYYANWLITNDLSWTVRFGAFFPGRAFDDQTSRTFVMTGMTWSF